jgi:hypothetical protein
MNFEEVGIIIAKIKNTNNPKLDKIVSVETDKNKVKERIDKIQLDKEFEIMQHIPSNRERDVVYITGQSGSGKSYYTKALAEEYRNKFKNNGIYLFSSVEKDALDKIKGLKRVKITNDLLNVSYEDLNLNNCLLIFDDTDVISNKFYKKKVDEILNIALQKGRHNNVSIYYTSHQPNNGKETKIILAEAHSIVFFNTLGNRSLKYLLESSFGFSTKQINNIRKIDSRWYTIFKTFPLVVMHQKGAYVVDKTDL